MPTILSHRFFQRDTVTVARELLGTTLVHIVGGQRVSGRIVETEAYLGIDDPAAHSFGGRRTERVRSMYLSGGHAYVYFIYGMYFCFNVVTQRADVPEAVLIRALTPVEGLDFMRKRRKVKRDRDLTNGPAKLCQALAINRKCDGLPLGSTYRLFIESAAKRVPEANILSGARIGIEYAGPAARWPLNFKLIDT